MHRSGIQLMEIKVDRKKKILVGLFVIIIIIINIEWENMSGRDGNRFETENEQSA